ncbi:tetratricopeptide repeat protein [Streptomyces sp. CC219B]|uniref:tetratricopeptide repeat protein n=1 Tax=Streptomyces sp. CC219B TaxID=3044574 RepID=UPI0024A904C7|nr:tetratricopeptide repeat protein [Streptomyces sp. CC219B]
MGASAEASGERSIAAGQSIRQAVSGDASVAMYTEKSLALPAEAFVMPDRAPGGLVNLPDKAVLFVGRDHELGLLDTAFSDVGGVVVQAVHGLGGIGKSTLAARWAAGRTGSYNPVWWINAETPADIDAGLADLAVALQPALRDVMSREALRERAVQWLSSYEGWLLVLDNVSDPADVRQLLARASGGRVLITSRRATGWQGVAEPVPLDVLELPQAVELFGRIYGGPVEGVEELCRELGCLPLAVEQAAAYCSEAGISARRYRELLDGYPAEMFAQAAEGTDAGRTVARVWRVTLDRLADTPLAVEILQVIAWWAPDGIPRAYVEGVGSPVEVTDALRRLAAYSMITLQEDDAISVHRLVQAVARAEGAGSAHMSVRLLGRMGGEMIDVAAESRWLAHLDVLAAHVEPETDAADAAWLFTLAGVRKFRLDPARAIQLLKRALAAAQRAGGPRHELTLMVRACLAHSYGWAGEHERAIGLFERNLADHVRTNGRRHPETFGARTELARAMQQAERTKDAVRLARRNAKKAERVLGAEDAATLTAWSLWVELQGNLAMEDPDRYAVQACDATEKLLVRAVAVTGIDSMLSRSLRFTLAWARNRAGDDVGAAVMYEAYIEGAIRARGATDKYTLEERTAFVRFLWKVVCNPARAREVLVGLLADWERLVGDGPQVQELRQEFAPLLEPPTEDGE